MPSLYELEADFIALLDAMEHAPTEDRDLFADAIAAFIDTDIATKVNGYCRVIADKQGDVDAIKAEERRLADRRRAIENNIGRLKDAMQEALELIGRDELRTPLFSVRIQASSPRVVVDESKLPPDWWVTPDPKPNSAAIRDAIKRGEEIPGARLESGKHIRIR